LFSPVEIFAPRGAVTRGWSDAGEKGSKPVSVSFISKGKGPSISSSLARIRGGKKGEGFLLLTFIGRGGGGRKELMEISSFFKLFS